MNIYFDPISTSQLASVIITLVFMVLSFMGFFAILKLKDDDGESRCVYGIICGLLICACLTYTGCQTTGCTDSGNYDILILRDKTNDRVAHTQQLMEENKLLRGKIELLKIEHDRGQPIEAEEYGPEAEYKPHPQDTTP